MTGRSIIVTGGFGVLGQAVSAAFAAAGDRVARVDFAAAPIGGTPAGGLDIGGADLADAATAARVVADVVAAQGGLDVLVNVAGGFVWQPLADDDGTSWPRMFALNALTCRNMCAAALPALLPVAMPFSGQICFSQTRLLLPASRYDEMLEALVGAIDGITLGDPWEAGTMMGPLAMARQRARVLGYIAQGRAEGARLLCGGDNGGFARGYFVAPTLFADVQPAMAIAREEIFGPVLSVLRYRDEAEAIALANDSAFGLSGTVFTPDLERGTQIARAVRTGNISINTLQLDPAVPFGGFRQSGIGREGGPEGLAVFQETKAIYLPVLAPHTL